MGKYVRGPRRQRRQGRSIATFVAVAAVILVAAGFLVLRPPQALVRWLQGIGGDAPRAVWADADRVASFLAEVDEAYSYRPAGSDPERHVADYVARQLRACGYEAWELPFTRAADDGQAVSINVVALKRSALPGAPTVLLGAPMSPGSALTVTGFDDASGLAAMLECARLLVDRQLPFNVSFAAFGGTAHGRAGSKAFCDGLASGPVAAGGLAMVIVLDAVNGGINGMAQLSLIPWGGPRACPPGVFAGMLHAVEDTTGSRVGFDTTLALLTTVAADSSPFIVSGTPALTMTTSPSTPHFRVGAEGPPLGTGRAAETRVRAAAAARAADAALAALLWAGDEAAAGRVPRATWAPYLALRLGGRIVAVPHGVAIGVAVAALVAGAYAVASCSRLLWARFDPPRSSGFVSAMLWAMGLYAVMAAVLWTGSVPTALVGLVRGLRRPWTAHPWLHAAAGVCVILVSAAVALRTAGRNPVSSGKRAPLLQISLGLQMLLVFVALLALRAVAMVPAMSLLLTVAALRTSARVVRNVLAAAALAPVLWLTYRLAVGVGVVTVADLLEVPVVLALLAAAALLPYVVAVFALGRRRQPLDAPATPDGLDSVGPERARRVWGVGGAPGSVLREFKGPVGGRGGGGRGDGEMPVVGMRRRGRVSLGLIGVMAILALVITGSLFAFPSYTGHRPRIVLATLGAGPGGQAQVVLESRESLAGVTVSSVGGAAFGADGAAGTSVTMGESVRRQVVPLGGAAPQAKVDAKCSEATLTVTASGWAPLQWAVAEVRSERPLAVAGADCSYALLQGRGGVDGGNLVLLSMNRVSDTEFRAVAELAELAEDALGGVTATVTVRAGVEPGLARADLSGSGVRFLVRNEYLAQSSIQ